MSSGLIALLDDVAALAKVAAASLDDAVGQSAKAGSKAVGIVIDDAAVTPRYVVGFAAAREVPIVARIAWGSLRNKLVFLLPGALLLDFLAPWAITPLLMAGGVYLCFEGVEKLMDLALPHAAHGEHADTAPGDLADQTALEEQKIASAIRTDLILSAEIMAITLSSVTQAPFVTKAVVLGVVGVGITILVYGGVALIVKADDAGLALARNASPVSSLLGIRALAAEARPNGLDRAVAPVTRSLGRALVTSMPSFLSLLSGVGTAAMLWVGGGILIHGLETYHIGLPAQLTHEAAAWASSAVPALAGIAGWFAGALASAFFGLGAGALALPLVKLSAWLRSHRGRPVA